ncbi:MAG: RsmF rRNA methyltransferase first C-terminal domain-containing protein [Lachnospiraceae bacterium]
MGLEQWPIAGGSFTMFGEELYLVPKQMVDMKGLKVLRPGLDLGTIKKGRFEPSHGLALFLKKEWAGQWIDLPSDSEEITRYLRGETLNTDQLPGERHLTGKNGWVLVCVDGCSLGWSKKVGITLKNHYPERIAETVENYGIIMDGSMAFISAGSGARKHISSPLSG